MKKFLQRLSKINKVVIYLSLSDVFTWGPYTIISLLTGLYLSSKLGQDVVQFVGVGTSIYFFTRALLQIPVGVLTDRLKSDKDEIFFLFSGVLLMGFPFLFLSTYCKSVSVLLFTISFRFRCIYECY